MDANVPSRACDAARRKDALEIIQDDRREIEAKQKLSHVQTCTGGYFYYYSYYYFSQHSHIHNT